MEVRSVDDVVENGVVKDSKIIVIDVVVVSDGVGFF